MNKELGTLEFTTVENGISATLKIIPEHYSNLKCICGEEKFDVRYAMLVLLHKHLGNLIKDTTGPERSGGMERSDTSAT